ncbi:MAG: hypothetical protein PHD97_04830 [Bacteroidales bacterium]|nr:hypothetical protein [Bacteroidales bacterium]
MKNFNFVKLAFEVAGYSIVKTTRSREENAKICTSELSDEKYDIIQKGKTTNTLTKSEIIELARKNKWI